MPAAQPTSRQQSAAIQQAADQFVALIEGEKARAQEAAERRLALLEAKYAQHQQYTSTALAAALGRATAAEERLRAALVAPPAVAPGAEDPALTRAQDEARLLSEAVAVKDQRIRELRQALSERDQQIANLNERILELERRSSGGGENLRASGNPAMHQAALGGKDDDAMMEFLNIDECAPVVSPLSASWQQ